MRTRLDHLVTSTLQQGSAVPAFTCYDFTTAMAVVGAAEEAGQGVILLVAPKTAGTVNGLRLISALRGLADAAAVPVSVQLDHASDLGVMIDAVAAGADSVLADGSSLPYEDNIALVLAARSALGADVVLEAELGGLPVTRTAHLGRTTPVSPWLASLIPPRWRTLWAAPVLSSWQ